MFMLFPKFQTLPQIFKSSSGFRYRQPSESKWLVSVTRIIEKIGTRSKTHNANSKFCTHEEAIPFTDLTNSSRLCQAIGLFTRRSALPKEKANAPDGLDFGSVQNLETQLSQDPGLQKLATDRAKAPGKVDRSTKFLGQPSLAINCGTAFLIAPDIIVTAAHCIFEKATTGFNQEKVVSDIQDWVFVLNYWYTNENTLKVLQKDIYHVKE